MITYPNQKIIHINKGEYTQNYLTVGIEEWTEASKVLKPNTFKVYLYLCSNADGFDLALSRQDAMNKLGISLDSYKRAIKELTDKKYIELKQGNVYDFYTMPNMVAQKQPLNNIGCIEAPIMGADKQPLQVHTSNHNECIEAPSMGAYTQPEINNINNIDNLSNISKDADAKKERDFYKNERGLEDLSNEELYNLDDDFKCGIKYIKLTKKYNLKEGILDKKLSSNIDGIINQRKNQAEKSELITKNNEMLSKWEINSDEGQELFEYVFGKSVNFYETKWASEDIDSYKYSFYDTGMNPKELLLFFRDNKMATRDFYDKCINTMLDKTFEDYSEYLKKYIDDIDNTINYAKSKLNERKSKENLINYSNDNNDNAYIDDFWASICC